MPLLYFSHCCCNQLPQGVTWQPLGSGALRVLLAFCLEVSLRHWRYPLLQTQLAILRENERKWINVSSSIPLVDNLEVYSVGSPRVLAGSNSNCLFKRQGQFKTFPSSPLSLSSVSHSTFLRSLSNINELHVNLYFTLYFLEGASIQHPDSHPC